MPNKFERFFRSGKTASRSLSTAQTPEGTSAIALPSINAQNPSLSIQALQSNPREALEAQVASKPTVLGPVAIAKGTNYGITVLHDAGQEAVVDIVFVHGLTGNAYDTWLHEKEQVHWPSTLLKQDISDCRILSFGYDADVVGWWNPASKSRLSNHAESMVGALARLRERTNTETRKIIFVAHSLGGLVTQGALIHSRNNYENHICQIERFTYGIIFMGTPHHGSDLGKWAKLGTNMVKIVRCANQDIVRVLEPGSEVLDQVQSGFHIILRKRKHEGYEIAITCFWEELPVAVVGLQIVPQHSAKIQGYACYGIHANHTGMTKFSDRDDAGYEAVLGELLRWKKASFVNTDRTSNQESRQVHKSNDRYEVLQLVTVESYTERRGLLEELIQKLHGGQYNPDPPRNLAVVGLGGSGKTQLVLRYIEENRDRYKAIFWINADDAETALYSFERIAEELGLSSTVDQKERKMWESSVVRSVLSWLKREDVGNWLVVLDNSDSPEWGLLKIVPKGRNGSVIITSRLEEACDLFERRSNVLEVYKMEKEEAVSLLLKGNTTNSASLEEIETATKIAEVLGYLALALDLARAFIEKSRHRSQALQQYLHRLMMHKKDTLKRDSIKAFEPMIRL